MKKLPSHVPAQTIIKATGIPRRTFFSRVILNGVSYIEPFNSERLYSLKDWNKRNSDYQIETSY